MLVEYTTASTSTSHPSINDNNKLIEDEMMTKVAGNPQRHKISQKANIGEFFGMLGMGK